MKLYFFVVASFLFCSPENYVVAQNINPANIVHKKTVASKADVSIKIIKMTKSIEKQSSGLDEFDPKVLKKWNLTADQIRDFFKANKIIGGTTVDLSYEVLPYHYYGQIQIHKQVMDFDINAGGYGTIYSKNHDDVYYAAPKKLLKFFLSGPYEE